MRQEENIEKSMQAYYWGKAGGAGVSHVVKCTMRQVSNFLVAQSSSETMDFDKKLACGTQWDFSSRRGHGPEHSRY